MPPNLQATLLLVFFLSFSFLVLRLAYNLERFFAKREEADRRTKLRLPRSVYMVDGSLVVHFWDGSIICGHKVSWFDLKTKKRVSHEETKMLMDIEAAFVQTRYIENRSIAATFLE